MEATFCLLKTGMAQLGPMSMVMVNTAHVKNVPGCKNQATRSGQRGKCDSFFRWFFMAEIAVATGLVSSIVGSSPWTSCALTIIADANPRTRIF